MNSNFIQKIKPFKWEILTILLILTLGIFLRTYNFQSWLHFEIDQDYDILLVNRAVTNGISNLPLLGPNAGGGLLRLGPAYYYMEYVSAEIFGNTPAGNAAFVLILSILALPLFYLFSRRYFSKPVSIGLLAIFSLSFYSILYSRFAWSPNVLPFLMLLAFLALLKSVSEEEKRGEMWFLLSVLTAAIITQTHFNVFFTVPVIFVAFLLIKRPRFRFRTWLAALGLVLIIYSPVILSDLKTHGQNLGYFFEKTEKETNYGYDPTISTKLVQDIQYFSSEYFLINSGVDHINGGRMNGIGLRKNDPSLPWRIGALILFLAELLLLIKGFFNFKKKKPEEKDFLILSGLWFFVFFLYFSYLLKSGYNMYPRFFLPLEPLAIIFFGFLLEKIRPETNKKRLAIFSLIIFAFCLSNLINIRQYFNQLSNAKTNSISVETEDVLPNTARVTLSQQDSAINYIESIARQNGYPVYINTVHEYESVLWYQLEKDGIEYQGSGIISGIYSYREGNYFLVFPTNKDMTSKPHFINLETETFGSLMVAHVTPKPDFILFERQDPSMRTMLDVKEEFYQVKTWKDLFKK